MNHDTPLFSSALLGFRCWQADELGALYPLTSYPPSPSIGIPGEEAWEPGVNQALCNHRCEGRPGHTEPAPAVGCSCGLYARYRLSALEEVRRETIVGAIAARGNVCMHAGGFRAQEAQILGFIDNPYSSQRRLSDLISERYQIPCLASAKQLQNHSEKFAKPVPAGLLPELLDPNLSDSTEEPVWAMLGDRAVKMPLSHPD